jgi:hypothetical protein
LVKDTGEALKRDERWSEGSHAFVERIKRALGIRARYREVDEASGTYALCEPQGAYAGGFAAENSTLRPKNTIHLTDNPVNADT